MIRDPRGFTLLEMLMSVAVLGLIGAIGIPTLLSFQTRTDVHIAATTLAQTARRAQVLAQASDGDSSWGIRVATGTVTVFKGESFIARDTAYDEVYEISAGIMATGTSEYTFAKLTGWPTATGTTTLVSPNLDTRTATINAKGTITY